jgi:proteasome accessory factor C
VSISATARLSRLLSLVPWLLEHQGVPLAEVAAHFSVSEAQLVKDLELLFVCGTPGHLPDDLIEADWESGRVYLRNADAIARPLRLSLDEAVALLAGLRALSDVPGLHDRDVVESVATKLAAAAGDGAASAGTVSVDLARGASEPTLRAVREALQRHHRLHLRYLVPSRDETTERDVDPLRLLTVGDRWYLEGWCHRAEAVRRFRLDRVVGVEVLEVAADPPRQVRERRSEQDGELFHASPEDLVVTLDLDPAARWVAEYYPVDRAEELSDGALRVVLRSATADWPARLALRLGGSARVVGPRQVIERVRELAAAGLAGYAARS